MQLMLPTPMGRLCPAYTLARWGGGSIEAFFIRAVTILDFCGLDALVQARIIPAGSRFGQVMGMIYAHPANLPPQQESLRRVFHQGPLLLLVWSWCSPHGAQISLKGCRRWFSAMILLENDEIVQEEQICWTSDRHRRQEQRCKRIRPCLKGCKRPQNHMRAFNSTPLSFPGIAERAVLLETG